MSYRIDVRAKAPILTSVKDARGYINDEGLCRIQWKHEKKKKDEKFEVSCEMETKSCLTKQKMNLQPRRFQNNLTEFYLATTHTCDCRFYPLFFRMESEYESNAPVYSATLNHYQVWGKLRSILNRTRLQIVDKRSRHHYPGL